MRCVHCVLQIGDGCEYQRLIAVSSQESLACRFRQTELSWSANECSTAQSDDMLVLGCEPWFGRWLVLGQLDVLLERRELFAVLHRYPLQVPCRRGEHGGAPEPRNTCPMDKVSLTICCGWNVQ